MYQTLLMPNAKKINNMKLEKLQYAFLDDNTIRLTIDSQGNVFCAMNNYLINHTMIIIKIIEPIIK